MINIWEYQGAKRISLVSVDGQTLVGTLVAINCVEDEADEYGFNEDSLTLWVKGQPISIMQSEIAKIEVLE
jgi:hypothetical protein